MTQSGTRIEAMETGHVRLYTIDTAQADGAALRAAVACDPDDAAPRIAAALGVASVDPHWVTLVPMADVRAIGLATYLRAGHDIPDDQLATKSTVLARAAGHLLLVLSPAFQGRAESVAPAPWLVPLAHFTRRRDPTPTPQPRPERTPVAPTPDPVAAPARRGLPPLAIGSVLVLAALVVLGLMLLGS